MEAVTTGEPAQGFPFKVENKNIVSFDLPVKKSDIDTLDRQKYSFDVSVTPVLFDDPVYVAPRIVLQYRAVDESIAVLPKYQFPDDAAATQIAIPDFKGKTVKEAKAWLNEKGLRFKLSASGPAPSETLSFKIKETEPNAASKVILGSEVTIRVYEKHSLQKILIPELEGLSVKEAKSKLQEKGFNTRLVAGEAAPSEELSLKVKETEPKAASKVPLGSEVTIKVYGKHDISLLSVPDVTGMSWDSAKKQISEMGLKVKPVDAGSAPSNQKSETVAKSKPGAGEKVKTGAIIEIYVYSKYSPRHEELVAQTDCSKYPGTYAFWDEKSKQAKCRCSSGYIWSTSKNKCIEKTVAPSAGKDPNDLTGEWNSGEYIISRKGNQYVGRFNRSNSVYPQGSIRFKFEATQHQLQGFNHPVYMGKWLLEDSEKYGTRWLNTYFELIPQVYKTNFCQRLQYHINWPDGTVFRPHNSRCLGPKPKKHGKNNSEGSRSGGSGTIELDDNDDSLTIFGQDMDD